MAERSSVRRQFRNRGPRVLSVSRISRRIYQLRQGDQASSTIIFSLVCVRSILKDRSLFRKSIRG